MRRQAFAILLFSAISCHDAIDVGVRAVSDKRTRDDLFFMSSFLLELEPAPSPSLEEGKRVFIQVRAVFKSGEVCRFCEASWSSSAPEVAAFSEPNLRCAGGRCIFLDGVSPGTAALSVQVCQPYERDCVRKEFHVRVVH